MEIKQTPVEWLVEQLNKNPDTKVISYWPAVYNCNKIIQPISYDSETKGLFDLVKDTYIQ